MQQPQLYDAFAKQYAELAEHSAHNAFCERPAMLNMIGEVKGKKILDTGCGSGIYSEIFLNAGAEEVTGFDISRAMIEIYQARLGNKAQVFQADIEQPLAFARDNYYDIILCSLVLHYCKDWSPIFCELSSKLRSGGSLFFSTGHPLDDFESSQTENYFEVELLMEYWPSLGTRVPNYRRSLTHILESFADSGLQLVKMIEPRPHENLKERDPKAFAKLNSKPAFICFHLTRP